MVFQESHPRSACGRLSAGGNRARKRKRAREVLEFPRAINLRRAVNPSGTYVMDSIPERLLSIYSVVTSRARPRRAVFLTIDRKVSSVAQAKPDNL